MYQPDTMFESNSSIIKIAVEDALGATLAHDMTQIIPGKYKGTAFKKGDVIQKENLCQLMRMGKRHLYVLDLNNNQVHEDDAAIVKKKVENFGAVLKETIILPDDFKQIASTIDSFLKKDTDLILTTGGMSVDPDDVTKTGIQKAGFDKIYYSSAVLPGAMFLLGYKGDIAVMGLPACGLYHDITIFDLMLPRILAGERPDNLDLAKLGHGGLCMNCKTCTFPACSFGKSC